MMTQQESERSKRIGRGLVHAMPNVLTFLTVVGTAAMLWVGGHILVAGAHELGWDWPYDVIRDAEAQVEDLGGIGGFLAWLVNTAISAVVGLAWGCAAMFVASLLPFGATNGDEHEAAVE